MKEEAYFVTSNGDKISCDGINSHVGLANELFKQNEQLKKEFEESGKQSPLEFLLEDKGFMTVSNMEGFGHVIYDSDLVTDEQRRWLMYFNEEGYSSKDLAIDKKELERGEK